MDQKSSKKFLCIQLPTLVFHFLFLVSRHFISYSEVVENVIGMAIILGYTLAVLQLLRSRRKAG